jgi:uncharacterized membrane protein
MKKIVCGLLFGFLVVFSAFSMGAPQGAGGTGAGGGLLSFFPFLTIVAIITIVVIFARKNKKPLSAAQNYSSDSKYNGYPLSNLTAKLFSIFFEIILWIILIGGVVGGGILGKTFAPRSNSGGYIFVGIILGGITAFIIIILTGGLVSLFIKLVNNTEEINKK